MLTRLALSLTLAGTLAICPGRAGANPGDLDSSFGTGGKVTTAYGLARALAVQTDGKLAATGDTYNVATSTSRWCGI